MSTKFYTLLTDIGAAKLASAAALGVPLKITHMAVGDGGGVLPTPDAKQTALVNEKRRAALNMLYIDPQNSSQIIAEQVIPENEGGWWIREVGLFDESGALIAVGNCPESYKPQLAEGSGRTQTVRMVLITSSTDNITLKIDPAVVLATRKYVDDKALELKVYVDDLMAKHLAAPDPHSQYAPKESPTFTGTPKAPTPAAGNNTTQLATTAFVQAALTALINGAPATLDTLKEIAAAINNDPKFSTTINNALSGKQPLDETLTHLSGKDVAGLLAYLGLEGVTSLRSATFTSSTLWTAPAGVTEIELDGAGAGGGGGTGGPAAIGGGGGGAGETVVGRKITVVPGTTYTITIGLGGDGGTSVTSNGGDGGTTSFGTLLSLAGGKGGLKTGAAGVAGGTGGNDGLPGTFNVTPALSFGGAGGSGLLGAGGGAALLSSVGGNAGEFGGGGGGGAGNKSGGHGANGLIRIRW
ncbi:TPA: phage tail protein [Escherichia coli]|nr:phage tail protein [Escherichia coli]HCS6326966.1 phage tail protein [Escherichia coli]HCS6424368.1 phage tail protein [Escherichia coli]HCS6558878.1 phage tail protein [Escherichia coli]